MSDIDSSFASLVICPEHNKLFNEKQHTDNPVQNINNTLTIGIFQSPPPKFGNQTNSCPSGLSDEKTWAWGQDSQSMEEADRRHYDAMTEAELRHCKAIVEMERRHNEELANMEKQRYAAVQNTSYFAVRDSINEEHNKTRSAAESRHREAKADADRRHKVMMENADRRHSEVMARAAARCSQTSVGGNNSAQLDALTKIIEQQAKTIAQHSNTIAHLTAVNMQNGGESSVQWSSTYNHAVSVGRANRSARNNMWKNQTSAEHRPRHKLLL